MLFNSIDFAIFLPIVFILFWLIPKERIRQQNVFLVLASYLFYGWWDWRFLSLILISTIIDYSVGRLLKTTVKKNQRLILLWLSIIVNLSFLGFFKYYNFFIDNLVSSFSFFGAEISPGSLSIILPVGISFYTFQTLSYSIDVYRKKLEPTSDFIAFSAFVSFFPQLVAGPIERATNLLPQFKKARSFDYSNAVNGLRQILWGFFKKVVVADTCAEYANMIFNNSNEYSGITLVLGALFFAFQIYGDFSGYSDIAIGTSRLFGFNLMRNFAFPYFSRDIAEFWRRWHISLSTWFRDYLYIPIGGSRGGTFSKIRNTFIIFAVSGFWHGANWTFIIWGVLNAIYFIPLMLSNKNRSNIEIVAKGKLFPAFRDITYILLTFSLTLLAWVFFRAESVNHAFSYINGIFSSAFFYLPNEVFSWQIILAMSTIIVLIVVEWLGREGQYAIESIGENIKTPLRYIIYYSLFTAIVLFWGKQQTFIYFQF